MDLDLGWITILKGKNNAGKSNILSIPGFFRTAVRDGAYAKVIERMGGFHALINQWSGNGEIQLRMETENQELATSTIWTLVVQMRHSTVITQETMYQTEDGGELRTILDNHNGQAWYISGNRKMKMEKSGSCIAAQAAQDPEFPGSPMIQLINSCRTIRLQTTPHDLKDTLMGLSARNNDEADRIGQATKTITGLSGDGDQHQPSPPVITIMEIMDSLHRDNPPRLIIMDSPEWGIYPDCMIPLAEHIRDESNNFQLIISTNNEHITSAMAELACTQVVIRNPYEGTKIDTPRVGECN